MPLIWMLCFADSVMSQLASGCRDIPQAGALCPGGVLGDGPDGGFTGAEGGCVGGSHRGGCGVGLSLTGGVCSVDRSCE